MCLSPRTGTVQSFSMPICLLFILDEHFYALYYSTDTTFAVVISTGFDELYGSFAHYCFVKYSSIFYQLKAKAAKMFLC
jgi:hypothetical protein